MAATPVQDFGNRLFLTLVLLLCLGCGSSQDASSDYPTAQGAAPLRERAAARGLFYGAATSNRILDSDPAFAAAFAKECSILVPEWELKWGTLRPSPTSFDFSAPDRLLSYSRTHNMLFRGHTLVWHRALPAWFAGYVTAANAEQLLREHVTAVVSRYAGKVHSWDVVNEAVAPEEGHPEGLRTSSPWYQLLGPRYIEIAFRAAAAADPSALLVYNEYGTEHDTPEAEARRAAVLHLLRDLKSKGIPVHALGIQAHLSASKNFSAQRFQNFLQQVSELGLKIIITELDVSEVDLPPDLVERDRTIALRYADFLAAALHSPALVGVLTWGLSDRYSWINVYHPRRDQLASRPLPLDEQMERKLVWHQLSRALDGSSKH